MPGRAQEVESNNMCRDRFWAALVANDGGFITEGSSVALGRWDGDPSELDPASDERATIAAR